MCIRDSYLGVAWNIARKSTEQCKEKMLLEFTFPAEQEEYLSLIHIYINAFGKMAMAGCGSYSKIEGFAFLPVTCFTICLLYTSRCV